MQQASSSLNTNNNGIASATTISTASTNDSNGNGKFSIVDLTDEVKLKTQLKGDKLLKVNKQFRSNTEFQANYFFFKTDKNDRKKRKNSSSHSVVTPTDDDFLSSSTSQYDAAAIHHDSSSANSNYSHKRRNTISGISLLQTTFNVSGLHHSDSMNQLYHSNNTNPQQQNLNSVTTATTATSELNGDDSHPLFIDTSAQSMYHSYSNDSIYTPTKVVRISSSYPNNFSYGGMTDSMMMDLNSNSNSSTPRSSYTSNNSGMISPPPNNAHNNLQRVQSFGGQPSAEFDFFTKLLELEGSNGNTSMFNVGGSNTQSGTSDSVHRQRRSSIRRASVSTPRGGSLNAVNANSNVHEPNSSQQTQSVVNMNSVDLSQLSQSFNYQQFKQRYASNHQPIKIPQQKANKMRIRETASSSYSYSPVSRTPVSSHSSNSDIPSYDFSSFLISESYQQEPSHNTVPMQQTPLDEISMIDTNQEDSMIGSFENVFLQDEDEETKQQERDENMDEFLSMFLP
ncbi:predicted protein [Naegleria gruberi]|uniref:Predicted protein n=1 Tax=Naegleria gruberi TaxID=5762 RepID=D2VD52_NAEGR|nr:uncharacterized protein NAEGRDRAFT_79523 [Naegleria gruberi]EFC45269.1 predicted protein [Naegleria gruberi]|eukprot:XP_002678013.1 predicted protein [Naegleria gruberi strain NEG-M]